MFGYPISEAGEIVETLDEMDLGGAEIVPHDLPELMPCLALVQDKQLYILVDEQKPCWCQHTVCMLREDGPRLHAALRGDLIETG